MQKSECSLCKSENPLFKKIPSEKYLLLKKTLAVMIFLLQHTVQFEHLSGHPVHSG